MKFFCAWIVLLMPCIVGAVQVGGAPPVSGTSVFKSSTAPAATPMLQGIVNFVAVNGTSININGVAFSSTAMTQVHTAAGLATLGAASIPAGSTVRFMLAALSADGRYHGRPRIAQIWIVQ